MFYIYCFLPIFCQARYEMRFMLCFLLCVHFLTETYLSILLTKQNQFNHGKKENSYFKLEVAFIVKCDLLEANNVSCLKKH